MIRGFVSPTTGQIVTTSGNSTVWLATDISGRASFILPRNRTICTTARPIPGSRPISGISCLTFRTCRNANAGTQDRLTREADPEAEDLLVVRWALDDGEAAIQGDRHRAQHRHDDP